MQFGALSLDYLNPHELCVSRFSSNKILSRQTIFVLGNCAATGGWLFSGRLIWSLRGIIARGPFKIHDHQRLMDPSPVRTTPPLEEDEGEWGMLFRQFPIFIFSFQIHLVCFRGKFCGWKFVGRVKSLDFYGLIFVRFWVKCKKSAKISQSVKWALFSLLQLFFWF